MKVLIVGGEGIIGSRMTELLGEWGHEPWVLGQRKTESPTYVRGDILYPTDIQLALARSHPDVIIHLAAEVSRKGVEATPIKTAMVNSIGTLNLAILASEADVPIVYASTSEVYGRNYALGTVTEDTPVDPYHNMYALTKYQGEEFITYFARNYALQAIIVRIFLSYGNAYPGFNTGMGEGTAGAIALFIHGLMSGKKVVAHTDTIRQWCYIDDMVEGLWAAAKRAYAGAAAPIYHIGRDEPLSAVEVARIVADVIGADHANIEERPCPPYIIPRKVASFEKAKRELAWEARMPLREGIARYASWLRPRLEAQHLL